MPETGWQDRVKLSDEGGFAYRPGEIIVVDERGVEEVNARFPGGFSDPEPVFEDIDEGPVITTFFRMRSDLDPLPLVRELTDAGIPAQPNHVLFAHSGCSCSCCGPHPSASWANPMCASPMYASPMYASPMYASPMYASPMYASPMYASPMYASPMYASPMYASTYRSTGLRKSSARPSDAPAPSPRAAVSIGSAPRIVVLDTGFAEEGLRPAALPSVQASAQDREGPDEDNNRLLDPAAGHGTFIAGIIERAMPGCGITVEKVLTTYGDGDEVAIARRIRAVAPDADLLNLSFGGYAMEQARVLASAVRFAQSVDTVVVASAGNDGTCHPTFPAALPGVVGVGAVGPSGPAPFSNYGSWVRACAPGVDIISSFFREFNGAGAATAGGPDPDDFASWALWSGTSFAAPAVVGALAREMATFAITARQAVERLIEDPRLLRIPGLGTVVNAAS